MTLVLALGLIQTAALADKKSGYAHKKQKKSVAEKVYKKAKMIYLYQDELNVTEDQLDQIHELKVSLKKDLIRKKAELKIVKVDIKSLLYEDDIDVKAVNKLIDQKYEIKKAKAKKAVESYAQLKKILTKEQLEKLKDISREHKKKKHY